MSLSLLQGNHHYLVFEILYTNHHVRSLEIRTLQVNKSLVWRSTTNTWWLVFDNYKMSNKKGSDSLELNPNSQQLLISYMELFINSYRDKLFQKWSKKQEKTTKMMAKDEQFVFLSCKSREQYYSDSSWSTMICNIFKQKTGMNISINMLRSSFVTYFYSSNASDSQCKRESVASGMRRA